MRFNLVSARERSGLWRALTAAVAVTAALAALFIFVNVKMRPFITDVTTAYAQNTVTNTLNSIVKEELKEHEYDFVEITYSPSGEVVAVSTNAIDTNLLRARLTDELRVRIADLEEKKIGIPAGNFLPYHFFSGLGPEVPIRFLLLSNTQIDVKESFSSKGINQTLYSIYFDVSTTVGVYIPTMSSTSEVKCNIPVSQTLIVGRVPESYTHVTGADGEEADIVLNMVG